MTKLDMFGQTLFWSENVRGPIFIKSVVFLVLTYINITTKLVKKTFGGLGECTLFAKF